MGGHDEAVYTTTPFSHLLNMTYDILWVLWWMSSNEKYENKQTEVLCFFFHWISYKIWIEFFMLFLLNWEKKLFLFFLWIKKKDLNFALIKYENPQISRDSIEAC